MNEDDLKLALALLEHNCPGCQLPESFGAKPELDPWCDACDGTGKVPLLDPNLVRKSCRWCGSIAQHPVGYHCEGRAWVPSEREMDWVRALTKVGWNITFPSSGGVRVRRDYYSNSIGGETLFEAAAQALGVTVKEAP